MSRSPAALALTAGAAVFAASIYLQAQASPPTLKGQASQPTLKGSAYNLGQTAGRPTLSGSAEIGQAATQQLLQRYCISCHNARLKTASLALDSVDLQNVAAQPQVWEKV